MRKRINGVKNSAKRNIIIIVVIFIFLFYVCLSFSVSQRKYLFIESAFKGVSSSINSFFIDKVYSAKWDSKNLVNYKIKHLKEENNKLKDALNLKKENEDYVCAKVVNHMANTWFNKLEINAGYDDGIYKDLPVVNSSGLVGFIGKTSKNVSEVKLLTSVSDDNLISVIIEADGNKVAGMLSDYSFKNGLFKITNVTSKDDIPKNSSVVLSGYNSALYEGLYVGKVVKAKSDNYGLSRTIWVKPGVNFDDLMYVLVPVIKEEK